MASDQKLELGRPGNKATFLPTCPSYTCYKYSANTLLEAIMTLCADLPRALDVPKTSCTFFGMLCDDFIVFSDVVVCQVV